MRLIILLFLVFSSLLAEIGKVSAVVGDAKILRNSKTIKVSIGSILEKNDTIETRLNSKVQIIFKDNTIATIGKSSALNINDYLFDLKNPKNSRIDLNFFKGAFKTITGKIGKINKKKFKIRTKSSTIGIRGTILIGNQNAVACTSGQITVTSYGKTVVVSQNEFTQTKVGIAPTKVQTLTSNILQDFESELEPEESTIINNNSEDSIYKSNESIENNENPSAISNTKTIENKSSNSSDDILIIKGIDKVGEIVENTEKSVNDIKKLEKIDKDLNSSDDSSSSSNSSADSSNVEYSQSGYFLGGYEGSSGTGFYHSDNSFSGKRVNNTYLYKANLTGTGSTNNTSTSNSGTFGTYIEPKAGSYSGFPTVLVGNIPFSYTNPNVSGNYKVYADNMGEVFFGYYNGTVEGTGLDEMFITGTDAGTIDDDKVYVYRLIGTLLSKKNTLTDTYSNDLNVYTSGDKQSYAYYNPKTLSSTYYSVDYLNNGATNYFAGDKNSVKAYSNLYNFNTAGEVTSLSHKDTSATISLYGTDLQGLASSITSDNYISTLGSGIITESQQGIGAGFLESDISLGAQSVDSSYTMKGFTSALEYDTNTSITTLRNETFLDNFQINVNSGTGSNPVSISGQLRQDDSSVYTHVTFNSNISDTNKNMYYINEDLFGTMFSDWGKYDTTHTLVSNTGYLVSVHDGGLDSNDNPVFIDDDSSWGYWTANFYANNTNSIYIDVHSPWVAGVIDSTAIHTAINNSNKVSYAFKGQVLGNVKLSSGSIEHILVNSNNQVNLNFDLGGGTRALTSGTMGFNTSSTSWDLGLDKDNSTVYSDGSFFSIIGSGGTGSVTGQFYGSGSIKSVGGVFNVKDSSSNNAYGVLKATKQ